MYGGPSGSVGGKELPTCTEGASGSQGGACTLNPLAWQAFTAQLQPHERGNPLPAYYRRLLSEDLAEREAAVSGVKERVRTPSLYGTKMKGCGPKTIRGKERRGWGGEIGCRGNHGLSRVPLSC
jgi:hypothetical protein